MKWNLSLPERPILVYYYSKLTGLAQFTVKKAGFHPPTLLNKLYTIVFAAIYFFVANKEVTKILAQLDTSQISQSTKIGASIQYFSSCPTTFLTLMIFVMEYKKILFIMNRVYDIGDRLKSFGIEEDHDKFFRNLFVTIVTTNAVVIAIYVTFCLIDFDRPILVSIKYTVDAWLFLNVVLIFTQILFLIRQRFKIVNEKLYNVLRPAGSRRSLNHLLLFMVSRNPRDNNQLDIEDLTDLQRIQNIEFLHLELCDLVHRTTNLFAIPILSKTVEYCTSLVLQCLLIYDVSRVPSQLSSTAKIILFVKAIVCPVLKMIITISHLFVVAYASVKTCEEGNAMKAMLCKVWHKFKPHELQSEFVMFSLQLMQKPVATSIFGYFNIDYSYVYQILGFVLAYVIIFIQFDTPQ